MLIDTALILISGAFLGFLPSRSAASCSGVARMSGCGAQSEPSREGKAFAATLLLRGDKKLFTQPRGLVDETEKGKQQKNLPTGLERT